jgi:HEAT repeat protein
LAKEAEQVHAAVRETVRRGLGEVGDALSKMEALRSAPDSEVVAAVAAQADSALRSWALRLVAERRIKTALEPTVKALDAEEESVSRAALAALVALGDERAVAALTSRVDFGNHDQMRVTIEALSVFDGEEVTSFLDFVATGHPSGEIQKQARDAMKRRRLAGTAP